MWATDYGLLIERFALPPVNKTNSSFLQFPNSNPVPTLFAFTHPLNEISPFLILKQGIVAIICIVFRFTIIEIIISPANCD